MRRRKPNHSMQRMGASRSAHFQIVGQGRLAPTADAGRSDLPVCYAAAAPGIRPSHYWRTHYRRVLCSQGPSMRPPSLAREASGSPYTLAVPLESEPSAARDGGQAVL
jgi:hypothetical protein